MSWILGDVSGSETLTDNDHIYASHINELRIGVDARLLKIGDTMTGALTIANANKATALIINNPATTGAEALSNEILFKPKNLTYGYGIISWYCDDYTRKDVIIQAHRAHYQTGATSGHKHLSLYTSNSARSSTVKRLNIPYGQDISSWTIEASTIEIQSATTSGAAFHVNHNYATATTSINVAKFTNGPNFPSDSAVVAISQYGSGAALSIVHQNPSVSVSANIDSSGKFGFSHLVNSSGGYGLNLRTNDFSGLSASNGLAKFAHLVIGDTTNAINIDMDANGKAIYLDMDDTGSNPSVHIDRDGNNATKIWGLQIDVDNAGAGGVGGIDLSSLSAGEAILKLIADAVDPTAGGAAATGRVAVDVGGTIKYLAYY